MGDGLRGPASMRLIQADLEALVRALGARHDAPMARLINFSPGPGTLPLPVLEEVQNELLEYGETGISMLEHSHRGPAYSEVHAETSALLKRLLGCEESHEVLYMSGGASTQFALLPMNYLSAGGAPGDYVDTGVWSDKAFKTARSYGTARWAASGREDGAAVRAPMSIDESENARYVHLTSNATVSGVQYAALPATRAPLVVDMSSDILHKPVDISGVSLLYAGAQKNLGPAGVTVVVVRKDFLAEANDSLPGVFSYRAFAENDSLGNTPPTFPIYMVGKVLKWLDAQGGPAAMGKRNAQKAAALYGALDANEGFYRCPVERESRSVMNAVFHLPSDELTALFLKEAAAQRMVNLKGHRIVGGIRVSMYNAVSLEHVQQLSAFIADFAKKNG